MNYRRIFSWKTAFYELLLPALRALGPRRADAFLGALGRLVSVAWPPRHRNFAAALGRVGTLRAPKVDPKSFRYRLAANTARFQARDYLLDLANDAEVLARFDVDGYEQLSVALEAAQGAILVGSHLGAHVAGLHWLYRRGVPLRTLVQRPWHISNELKRRFDLDGPHAQAGFFLRRDLPPGQCAERLLRARMALRDGLAVYMTGDIPWTGPNARPGRLLGQAQRFLSVWADLSALTKTPVFLIFCRHHAEGRYGLAIESMGTIVPGRENDAVGRYLSRLEARIAEDPADAVAHLLWPCYGAPATERSLAFRPSRRSAAYNA